jgi:hypothetical protein
MRPSALLRCLRLPLYTAPVLLILIFGFILTLAEHAGMFGIPAFVIVGSWFFKYGFAVLDHVVDGRPEPPVLSFEMVNPVEQRPLGTFLLLVFFWSATGELRLQVAPTVVTALRLMLLAAIPAMVAVMSVTGRFIDALNPIAVFGMIARIPVAYVTLLLGIGAMWLVPVLAVQASGASLAALWRVESFLPGQTLAAVGVSGALAGMLGLMLFMYLWLATFACIGGTIYQHRRELGIEAAESPERKAARLDADVQRERDKVWDRIFAQFRGGALANARESVRKLIAEAPRSIEECRWLYARASGLADQRLANYVAQLTLPRLLDTRATGEALEMVRARLTVAPDFRPKTCGQTLRLVQLARDAGDRSTARCLLVDFSRHYANDPMTVMAAQLQAELER